MVLYLLMFSVNIDSSSLCETERGVLSHFTSQVFATWVLGKNLLCN